MKNRVITATINEIGAKGDGLAVHDGKPIFVAKTAPGDVVEAVLGGDRASVQKILTPSPERAEPPCPYFAKCGGCSLQHVTPEFYRGWKIAKVQSALERAGIKVKKFETPVFLPAATRRRTSLTARRAGGVVLLGYNEARSHNILNINTCLILEPALDAKIQKLRPFLARLLPEKNPIDITLQYIDGATDMVLTGSLQSGGRFTLEQDEAFGEMMVALGLARLSWRVKDFAPIETILSRVPFVKKFGAVKVALPPAAFLQASIEGEEALVEIILDNTAGAQKILDLFSGCGTFTGHLLQTGANVTAIDGDKSAIDALAAARHPKLTATRRDLFKNPLGERELEEFDTVIFDPPRAGAKEQAEKLAYAEVRSIIGVSCNPASFARDAAALQEGGYTLQSLTLVDQFVYSAHVEMAGLFTKA